MRDSFGTLAIPTTVRFSLMVSVVSLAWFAVWRGPLATIQSESSGQGWAAVIRHAHVHEIRGAPTSVLVAGAFRTEALLAMWRETASPEYHPDLIILLRWHQINGSGAIWEVGGPARR